MSVCDGHCGFGGKMRSHSQRSPGVSVARFTHLGEPYKQTDCCGLLRQSHQALERKGGSGGIFPWSLGLGNQSWMFTLCARQRRVL